MNISTCSIEPGERGSVLLLAVFIVALLLPVSLFFSTSARHEAEYRKISSARLKLETLAAEDLARDRRALPGRLTAQSKVVLNSAVLSVFNAEQSDSNAAAQKALLILAAKVPGVYLPDWPKLTSAAKPGCASYSRSTRGSTGYPRRCDSLKAAGPDLIIAGDLKISFVPLPRLLIVLGDLDVGSLTFAHQAPTTLFALGKINIGSAQALPGSGALFIGSAQGPIKIGALTGISLCREFTQGAARLSVQSPSAIEIEGRRSDNTAGCLPELNTAVWATTRVIGIGGS